MRLQHFYSDEWCRDESARTQEQLQKIAKAIRENCKCVEIRDYHESDATGYICSIYENENLGLKYYIKDRFGHIQEIDETRDF